MNVMQNMHNIMKPIPSEIKILLKAKNVPPFSVRVNPLDDKLASFIL